MTAKPDATNAGERAMSIFQTNGGVLNTERAIKLGIPSQNPLRPSRQRQAGSDGARSVQACWCQAARQF